MFFTQEDYRKIEKWLLANSRKDTEFVEAATPLQGNETVVFVQNGKNRKIKSREFIEGTVSLLNLQGYSYIGVASPSTVPIQSGNDVFYLATEKGDYTHFGESITLDGTLLGVLKGKDKSWTLETVNIRLDAYDIAVEANSIAKSNAKALQEVFNELDSLDIRLESVEEELPVLIEELQNSKDNIESILSRLNTAEDNISNNSNDIDRIQKHLVNVDSMLNSHNSKISSLESQMQEVQSSIEEIRGDILNNSSLIEENINNIRSLQDRVTLIEASVDSIKESLIVFDSALSNLQEEVTYLREQVKSVDELLQITYEKVVSAEEEVRTAIQSSEKGHPGGVPVLDHTGKVPLSQLPPNFRTPLVDSYMSTDTKKAPTANALHELYLYHERASVEVDKELDALYDLISDSKALGVSPMNINIDANEQDVTLDLIGFTSWEITSIPDEITATPVSGVGTSKIVLHFPANTSQDNEVTGTIIIENQFGARKEVLFTQAVATPYYVYDFAVEPVDINLPPTESTLVYTVTSTKTLHLLGEPIAESEEVSYNSIVEESIDWITPQESSNMFTIEENDLEADRTGSIIFTQDESDKIVEVSVLQARVERSTAFVFNLVSPVESTVNVVNTGNNIPFEVKSQRIDTVNGKETVTDIEYVIEAYYEESDSSDWVSIDEANIVINENVIDRERTASIVFKQSSPQSKTITLDIVQEAAVLRTDYHFNIVSNNIDDTIPALPRQPYQVEIESYEDHYINNTLRDSTSTPFELKGEGPSWFTVSLGDFNEQHIKQCIITITENEVEEERGDSFTIQQNGSAKEHSILVNQEAAIVTYEVFESGEHPSSFTIDPKVDSSITLYEASFKRHTYVNGVLRVDKKIYVTTSYTTEGRFFNPQPLCVGADCSYWKIGISDIQENIGEERIGKFVIKGYYKEWGAEGGDTGDTVDVTIKEITITQKPAVITWNYYFDLTSGTSAFYDIPATGDSKSWTFSSYKAKVINGTETSEHVQLPFRPDMEEYNGFTFSSSGFSVGENTTETRRDFSISMMQYDTDGTTPTFYSISLVGLQKAATITYNYVFSQSTDTIDVGYAGGIREIAITSQKEKYINGTVREITDHPWSFATPEDSWYTLTNYAQNPHSITVNVSGNQGAERDSSFRINQQDSGKVLTINVHQEAGVISYEYVFECTNGTERTVANIGGETDYNIKSRKKKYINGNFISDEYLDWALVPESIADYISTHQGMGSDAGSYITYTVGENPADYERIDTSRIRQAETGTEIRLTLTQEASVITEDYALSIETSEKQVGTGTSQASFKVFSNMTRKVNGKPSSTSKVPISIDSQSNPSFNTVNISEGGSDYYSLDCNVKENYLGLEQVNRITVVQYESSKKVSTNLRQLAGPSIQIAAYIDTSAQPVVAVDINGDTMPKTGNNDATIVKINPTTQINVNVKIDRNFEGIEGHMIIAVGVNPGYNSNLMIPRIDYERPTPDEGAIAMIEPVDDRQFYVMFAKNALPPYGLGGQIGFILKDYVQQIEKVISINYNVEFA